MPSVVAFICLNVESTDCVLAGVLLGTCALHEGHKEENSLATMWVIVS